MGRLASVAAAMIAIGLAPAAHADCPAASGGTGTARHLDPANKTDVDLILSMSMMPRLLKITYANAAGHKLACDLAPFSAGGSDYDLRASPDEGPARIATSKTKRAPIAELIAVTDIVAAIEASKTGKVASVSGYMLATVGPTDTTGWRLYTAVPDQATLIADMTAAIEGRLKPVFRTDAASGKTEIFVPG